MPHVHDDGWDPDVVLGWKLTPAEARAFRTAENARRRQEEQVTQERARANLAVRRAITKAETQNPLGRAYDSTKGYLGAYLAFLFLRMAVWVHLKTGRDLGSNLLRIGL